MTVVNYVFLVAIGANLTLTLFVSSFRKNVPTLSCVPKSCVLLGPGVSAVPLMSIDA